MWNAECGVRRIFIAALIAASLADAILADDIRIATWNVHEGLSVEKIKARPDDFRRAGQQIKPDVLLVEEVTSQAVLEAVRDAMDLKDYYCVCSDFNPADEPDFAFLEVGIISKYPLDQVIEYDATPDNINKPGSPEELPLNPLLKLGIRRPVDDVRGFLWARIDQLKLTVAVVHLKSSRGVAASAEDRLNAMKREFVAAAMAAGVVEDRAVWPDYSCIVGGDFNIGHADVAKNGTKLDVDYDVATPGHDGYDETHALFRGGLIAGLKMHNLVGHTREPTFPSFPSTPIDNLYVTGPGEKNFKSAVIMSDTFGSDHCPVLTVFTTPVYPPTPKKPSVVATPKPVTSSPAGSVIASADARKHVDKDGTVEFKVNDSTLLADRRACFLNSLKDRSQNENFTVVLFTDGLKSFAAAGINDPAEHFRDKTIQVTGRISLRRGQCQIVVEKADQIHIVTSK